MKSSDFVSDIKKFDNRVKLFRFEKWSPWCALCGLIRFIRAAPFYRPNFSTCSPRHLFAAATTHRKFFRKPSRTITRLTLTSD